MRVRVEQVMTTPVETVDVEAAAKSAAEAMRRYGIHHLVVLDGLRPVGVVSDGDLRGRDLAGLTVREVMSANVELVKPSATIRELANKMRGRSIGCLPVHDGKRLVGIVTVSDLLELIGKGMARPVVRARRWTLKHFGQGVRTLRRG
jgi:CBS domain-containing protein